MTICFPALLEDYGIYHQGANALGTFYILHARVKSIACVTYFYLNKAKNYYEMWAFKGGLILESFSILQTIYQITILTFSSQKKDGQESGLVHFLEDGAKGKNLDSHLYGFY